MAVPGFFGPSRSRRWAPLAGVAALALVVSSCSVATTPTPSGSSAPPATSSVASPTPRPRPVVQVLRRGTVPAQPKRVVALRGAVGALLHRGIVPIATMADSTSLTLTPAERARIEKVPSVDVDGLPDLAKIKALKPDLVVGAYDAPDPLVGGTATFDELARIAPTVAVAQRDPGEAMEIAYEMANSLGEGAWAQTARTAYEQQAQHLAKTYGPVLARARFAPVRYTDGQIVLFGSTSSTGSILRDVGANVLPAGEPDGTSTLVPAELGRLDAATVALVFRDGTDVDPELNTLKALPEFAALPLAKAGRVLLWDGFFAERYDTGRVALQDLDRILRTLQQGG